MARWTSVVLVALTCSAAGLAAQDAGPAQDAQARMQMQTIARERPPQAEAAARAFLLHIVPERQCTAMVCAALDSLERADLPGYWMEVAQLTVQFDVFQQVVARDSARARQLAVLFGTEFEARVLQRAWRGASAGERRAIRARLEPLIARHLDVEDALRELEVRDIEGRVAQVRAETERRRNQRAELVRRAVDDIIAGAGEAAPQGEGRGAAPCYILGVTDFEGSVAAASGLSGLPPYVALEDAPLGPRGRRLGLPPAWQHASPYVDWAWWHLEGSQLVLSFRGPRGMVEVALRRAGSGYLGDVVTPLPSGIRPAQVMLEPSSCQGMTGRPR